MGSKGSINAGYAVHWTYRIVVGKVGRKKVRICCRCQHARREREIYAYKQKLYVHIDSTSIAASQLHHGGGGGVYTQPSGY